MIAMILAAGLGTRLKPHSERLPKPLFPIAGTIMLDKIIYQLADSGAAEIIINTHHLHHEIERHIRSHTYPVKIHTRFEPHILGTGGALKNIADLWQSGSLLVINSDIVCDIDLRRVCQFHSAHDDPVTMVMHDYPAFNGVCVNPSGFITQFTTPDQADASTSGIKMAYTGIQVVDHRVLAEIPADTFCSIIEIYKDLLARNERIRAYIAKNHRWHDMGSPAGYRNAVLDKLYAQALKISGPDQLPPSFEEIHLSGDGSDRKWSRLRNPSGTLVLVDHGITGNEEPSEAKSFICIGRHLKRKEIAVPTIFAADSFSGLVLMEDLGDENLQARFNCSTDYNEKLNLYRSAIDQLLTLSIEGFDGFDPKWTCQTERYDKTLILEKECRYFLDAFINGHLDLNIAFEELQSEFETLADMTINNALWGLMHRDCQSRNIMWHKGQCRFIDFQGARIGPIQYDLASLLIDPYVELSQELQRELLAYYEEGLAARKPQWSEKWQMGYGCCRLTRNLQILGAFAFLSNVKGKTFFAQFIPKAVATLKQSLKSDLMAQFTTLSQLVNEIHISK